MSEREVRRAAVLAQVAAKEWTLGEAAERMELSYRQTKRLWKQYRKPRGGGTGARERGAEIEPGQAAEVAGQGAAADPVAVLRRTKREIRADAGGGASGQRKGNRDWGRHPAAVDAGRRAVEPGKESAGASQPASPPRTFRRTGADGRQLPPVAGRTRATRLFDEPGG